jgi:hypothetical protein
MHYLKRLLNNVFIAVLLLGCNRSLTVPKIVSIDPALQSYVDAFVAAGHAAGHNIVIDNLTMHFATNSQMNGNTGDAVGECMMMDEGTTGTPRVLIDSDAWVLFSEPVKQAIIFHELGHCVLWLQHDTTEITTSRWDYIPRSIMYPYVQMTITYEEYWNYYTMELFNGPTTPIP